MKKLFKNKFPIIAVSYLPPSLGYKNHPGIDSIIEKTIRELKILEMHGVDGILLENENDIPYTVTAQPEVLSSMSIVAREVVKAASTIKVGVEFLINDPKASLSIAKASGSSFIRTDYFVDRMSRDEYGGEMYINPKELIEFRDKINASDIKILSDVQVKYAKMLEDKKISQSVMDAKKERSDAAVISANITGIAPDNYYIKEAKKFSLDFPVIIGSGLTPENINSIFNIADGAIVGTSILEGSNIIESKVKKLMNVVNKLRSESY